MKEVMMMLVVMVMLQWVKERTLMRTSRLLSMLKRKCRRDAAQYVHLDTNH